MISVYPDIYADKQEINEQNNWTLWMILSTNFMNYTFTVIDLCFRLKNKILRTYAVERTVSHHWLLYTFKFLFNKFWNVVFLSLSPTSSSHRIMAICSLYSLVIQCAVLCCVGGRVNGRKFERMCPNNTHYNTYRVKWMDGKWPERSDVAAPSPWNANKIRNFVCLSV